MHLRAATPNEIMFMSLQPVERRQESAQQPPRAFRFARSGEMIDCLRSELLYSDKRARDFLFRAIEQLVSSPQVEPMIVSRLTREAASLARRDAAAAQFSFHNWDTTSKTVVKAMLCAGVLLTPQQTPIKHDIAAQAAVVGGLASGYQDTTEAFLVEFLIRRLGTVSTRDHKAMAHALFRHFDRRVRMTDFEDRIVILIAKLISRVELRGSRYLAKQVS